MERKLEGDGGEIYTIIYTCGCGEQAVDMKDDFFECLHCDRECDITDCAHCEALEESDVDAFIRSLDEEEEEDGDADL